MVGKLVGISRSECELYANHWQQERNQIKRMEYAAYYNDWSRCPQTLGTMADMLGIGR
ncbi:MAG: hypothetical protein OXG65_06690 [Chloroflexi bacterium]|nr:hypothetical protein [Chloroflexota bacterium]